MSANNGVIRIGKKGLKKFAFGEDGAPFEVDVVVAFQEWVCLDETLRVNGDEIKTEDMPTYNQTAVAFVERLSGSSVTVAEALDFIARLREQYDELADFFRPKSREKRGSPVTSVSETRFSVEGSSVPSMN